ncbi:MAG TPA: NUDIX domain-containing protein [Candidatus Angelobacter sp.]|nr:NUDIX domain-containing protein [Candidatus Angelobacter sp.]
MAQFFTGLARLTMGTALPVQVAAVCYRLNGSSVEFLLVNTSSGKWTFPKGRLCPSLSPSESASREAWEEAGTKGKIEQNHFAHYLDTKRTLVHDSLAQEVSIAAFLLEVHSTEIPQESGRNPSWFSAQQTKKRLAEGRQAPYSRQIAKMIDAALDQLTAKSRTQTEILLRVQGRRRLASAR